LPLTDSISPGPPGSNLPSIPEGEAHQQQAASNKHFEELGKTMVHKAVHKASNS